MPAGRTNRYARARLRRLARMPAAAALVLPLAAAVACAGCGAFSGTASPGAAATRPTGTASDRPAPARHAPASPRPAASSPRPAASPSCPDQVLARMSEAQRVGQLFLIGLAGNAVTPGVAGAIRAYHFGSVVFGATSHAGAAQARQTADAVQSLASAQATAGVRFFVAANQEGGEVQALQGPGFAAIPSATEQGLVPPAALQRQAAGWGQELRSAGVNLDLAPVLDVVPAATSQQNQPIGVLHREFGHTPAAVAAHGDAFLRGLRESGVAATAKHFPGLGRVRGNTDYSSDVVDTQTGAGDPYLGAYQSAIDAGVPFVMVALATYTRIDPAHLAVFSPAVLRMLRQQMHFSGVIMSDDMGAARAVAGIPPASRALPFFAAGGDMITSESVPAAAAMAGAVLRRAAADPSFRAEVDAAARHVLAAKQAYGLLPCGSG